MRIVPKITVFHEVAFTTRKYRERYYLGCPINACKIFNDLGCQEIIINFASNTPDVELAKKCLLNINVPVTLGGFSRDINQITELMEYGAEKIIFPQKRVEFGSVEAKQLSEMAGSQAVAGCLDLCEMNGKCYLMSGSNRDVEVMGVDAEWISTAFPDYFGELIINNVSADGSSSADQYECFQHLLRTLNLKIPILEGGGLTLNSINERQHLSGVVIGTELSTIQSNNSRTVLQTYPEDHSVDQLI